MEKQPWVSMTVVPTDDDPDPVEIMSVNFLSDAQKAELGLTLDEHGRVLSVMMPAGGSDSKICCNVNGKGLFVRPCDHR